MFYNAARRVFAGLLALISFFVNLTAKPTKNNTPQDALSVVYADTACGDLKLFLPEQSDMRNPADVILMIHGGAWISGGAFIFYDDCRAAAKAGYIAASMNYSKIFNGASAADMAAEIGLAIAALKAELEGRGIPFGKLILAGHSSGAHIMLLYAYTHYSDCPMDIAFVVSNCAPADILADAKRSRCALGKAAYLVLSGLTKEIVLPSTVGRNTDVIRSVTPVDLVTPDVPPTIVVQGTRDEIVDYRNSLDLYDALQKNGVDCVHIAYEGAGHFLGSKGERERFAADDMRRAEAFYAFAEKYASQDTK